MARPAKLISTQVPMWMYNHIKEESERNCRTMSAQVLFYLKDVPEIQKVKGKTDAGASRAKA